MQVLLAPWWWRAARTALAAGAALLVVVVAEVGPLSAIGDTTVAVLLTVLSSCAVTAYMTWRQTRWARQIAGPAGAHARPESGQARKLRLTGALLLAVAVLTYFVQCAAESATVDHNCRIYGPRDPHFPEVFEGHAATDMCPVAPIRHAGDVSWLQGANGDYEYWFPKLGAAVAMSPAMLDSWLDNRPLLGDPVDVTRFDGCRRYVNFRNGYIVERPLQSAEVGREEYRPSLNNADCARPDTPYLASVVQDGDGNIQVDWRYTGTADAYNVTYWVVGQPETPGVEAARTHFVFDRPRPGVTYGFQVQACRKHFLGRSTCTGFSNAVAVRTLS
jgi:hypothetical protein